MGYHCDNKNLCRKYIGKCQINYDKLLNDANNKAFALKNTKNKQCGTLTLANISVLSSKQNTNANKQSDDTTTSQTTSHKAQASYEYAQSASNAKHEQKLQMDAIRTLQIQKSNSSRQQF